MKSLVLLLSVLACPACLQPSSGGAGTGYLAPVGDAVGSGGDVTPTGADSSVAAETAGKDAGKADAAKPDASVAAVSAATNPNCIDGQYSEALPDPKGDIASLKASYSPAASSTFVIDVLNKRYPFGGALVQLGMKKQDCLAMFLSGTNKQTAKGALSMLSTLVHECGHIADLNQPPSTYRMQDSLKFTCAGASHFGSNQGFARSLLQKDDYAKLRPACPTKGPNGCDNYASIYLDGDAKDGKFQGGDQAFSSVMEETTQYVNSLVTEYAFADQTSFTTSAQDGILTFLWYTERYLHMARLQFPDVHKYILSQQCWRQMLMTVWGRAWFYLELTKGNSKLTIDGAKILPLVMDPELLAEIDLVRQAEGCTAGSP